MCYKNTDNDAIRRKKESRIEPIPAHEAGIYQYKHQHWQIADNSAYRFRKIRPCEVKVDKTSDHQPQEIYYKFIIVIILIDKLDIGKNYHNVNCTYQPYVNLL